MGMLMSRDLSWMKNGHRRPFLLTGSWKCLRGPYLIIVTFFAIIFIAIRYGLKIPLDDSDDSIAKAILSTQNIFKLLFRKHWESPHCDVEGCNKFLISDGGMKIQRF